MHQSLNKQYNLLGCIKVRTNRSSDKQRFGQTEVQTNRGSDKQRRPLACPPCLRKIVFFVPLIALASIFSFLECIKVQIGNIIALDASKFGQTEVRTNISSDKQSFFTLDFFFSKKFFLENQQAYIFLTLPES